MSAYEKDQAACTLERAERYLRNYPDDGAAWLILGATLSGIARYEDAIRALRKAMRLRPDRRLDMPYAEIGHLYREKGSLRTAERWYRKAVTRNPQSTSNLVYLGAVLAKQGRFAEAKRYHRRAAGLGRGTWDEAYLNLGLILRAEGKYKAALECLDKAIEIDPKYKAAKRERKDVLEAIEIRKSG